MKSKGYTVIELLAVVTILVTVTGIIAALITQTLRGSSRTNITNQVSQSGNYIASVLTNTIITAEDVIAINGETISDCTQNPTGSSIEFLISERRGSVIYACENDSISSNSASLQDEDSAAVSLIDTSKLKIDTSSPSACYFTCRQASNDPYTPPVIEFGFTLTQDLTDALYDSRDSAPFSTSVLMRSYAPK